MLKTNELWIRSLSEQQPQPFNGPLSATTPVSRYQKKHSPTRTYPDYQPSFISFLRTPYSSPNHVFFLQHKPVPSQCSVKFYCLMPCLQDDKTLQ